MRGQGLRGLEHKGLEMDFSSHTLCLIDVHLHLLLRASAAEQQPSCPGWYSCTADHEVMGPQ